MACIGTLVRLSPDGSLLGRRVALPPSRVGEGIVVGRTIVAGVDIAYVLWDLLGAVEAAYVEELIVMASHLGSQEY